MADEKMSPIIAPKPPPAGDPLGTKTAVHASTLKLKPVIRKPVVGGAHTGLRMPMVPKTVSPTAPAAKQSAAPAAPAAPAAAAPATDALQQLQGLTQKLKGITQEIPQQAILHKTGIIADRDLTEAQKQASKSRTARISLSSAIGVAPVKEEAAPMKTIRIKRPVDLPSARPSAAVAPAKPPAPEPAAAPDAPVAAEPVAAPADKAPTLTQRKTLKIARPGAGGVRPAFGLKKPGAAPATAAAPAAAAESAEAVADIPDIPEMPPTAAVPAADAADRIADVPSGLAIFDLLLQVAACVAMSFLAYLLYTDASQVWF